MFRIKIEFQSVCRFALCIIYSIYSTERRKNQNKTSGKKESLCLQLLERHTEHWTQLVISSGALYRHCICHCFNHFISQMSLDWILFESNNSTDGINAKVHVLHNRKEWDDLSFCLIHLFNFHSTISLLQKCWM